MLDRISFRGGRMIRRVSLLAWCIGSGACSNVLGTQMDPTTRVTVGDVSVDTNPSTRGLVGTFPVTIQNRGTTVVWYNLCGNTLERRVGDDWQQVWAQMCSLSAPAAADTAPGVRIEPGGQLEITVRIDAWLGQGWDEPIRGQYRLRLGLYDPQGALSPKARTSDPFPIKP